ncbi:MAG: hypothetical protein WCF47_23670 [Pseudolabrys sp.]
MFVQRAHNIKKDSHGFVKESPEKNFKVRELVTPIDRKLVEKDVIPLHASAPPGVFPLASPSRTLPRTSPSQVFPLTLKGLAEWAAFSGHALPEDTRVANNAN